MIPRMQLFEFEDFSWFPRKLRDYMTDFLCFVSVKMKIWQGALPLLSKAITQSGSPKVLDLASGGGGGWPWLLDSLRDEHPNLEVTLSDLYPNRTAWQRLVSEHPEQIRFEDASLDATAVDPSRQELRTQFLSLHHLSEPLARAVIQNAIDARAPIAMFEAQDRTLVDVLLFSFSPLNVLFMTPFIRPFSLGRIFFTYLVPIVPLLVGWDGVVSVLRTYRVPEMRALVEGCKGHETYEWDIGKVKSGPGKNLHLIGRPKDE